MPQAYLNVDASPLGPALRRQPLVSVGIDEQGLDALALDVQAVGAEQHIRRTHPSGLELIVDVEPDPAHQVVVWHLGLAQSERGSSPRLTICNRSTLLWTEFWRRIPSFTPGWAEPCSRSSRRMP
jgi:hypothetical protein